MWRQDNGGKAITPKIKDKKISTNGHSGGHYRPRRHFYPQKKTTKKRSNYRLKKDYIYIKQVFEKIITEQTTKINLFFQTVINILVSWG